MYTGVWMQLSHDVLYIHGQQLLFVSIFKHR